MRTKQATQSIGFLNRHKVLLTMIGILFVGGGVWGAIRLWPDNKSTLPKELSAEALAAESNNPGEVMERVHQAMAQGNLTEAQRHELWRNAHGVMEARMKQQLDEYFAADANERPAILDRHISEMQTRMRDWEQRRPGDRRPPSGDGSGAAPGGGSLTRAEPGPGGPGGPGGDRPFGPPTRERRKLHSESRDPDEMARRMAYFTALHKRAEERGIQMPGPPGPPGMRRP